MQDLSSILSSRPRPPCFVKYSEKAIMREIGLLMKNGENGLELLC